MGPWAVLTDNRKDRVKYMSGWEIAGGILMIIVSIAIILLVLMQESPKGGGISALSGADSYYNKNQGRSLDAILARATKYAAIAFFVITIAVYAVVVYL